MGGGGGETEDGTIYTVSLLCHIFSYDIRYILDIILWISDRTTKIDAKQDSGLANNFYMLIFHQYRFDLIQSILFPRRMQAGQVT